MVKLYSLLIEKFNSFYVTSDDSGNRSKFIFWAIIASVFTERFIVYYCLLQNKNPDGPIFLRSQVLVNLWIHYLVLWQIKLV